MIAKDRRFAGQNNIRTVYRKGRTVRSANLSLRFISNNHQLHLRCAVSVSRKVHKSAVVRNRIRRRIYELIRLLEPQIIGTPDLVFTVFQPELSTLQHDKLSAEISQMLEKAQLLKPV